MLELVFVIVLVGVLAMLLVQWRRGQGTGDMSADKAAQFVQGMLTVTGVSDRPKDGDKNGDRFCTLSGTITGPQTAPTEVYGTITLGTLAPWPQLGTDMPVIYKPGKAETTWRFGTVPPPA